MGGRLAQFTEFRSVAALFRHRPADRDHGGPADTRHGLPLGSGAGFRLRRPYTIEEAYEVADAIARGDLLDLKDELGDLLLQVVFHARMAEEDGAFAFPDVVEAITAKLIRRHPHVFGEARDLTPAEVKTLWHRIKLDEKAAKAAARADAGLPPKQEDRSVLSGVPSTCRR